MVLVVFCAASARLFVWPPTDTPERVDAVVALGGDPGERPAYKALALVKEGYAPVAVVSLGGVPPAHCPRETHIRVICFRANPLDTRGEAQYVSALAARRHWGSLMVVPEETQTTRARILFKRCTVARLRWVPVRDPGVRIVYDVIYEWGALFKALFLERSC